jgi:D-sedoheptulose 7-phosphate isomerase
MTLQNRIINHFSDSQQIQQEAVSELCELIEMASQRIVAALLADGKVFTCGNGRSAVCAQLLCLSLMHQYDRDRPSLPAIALNTDATTLTGIATAYRFDEIFSKPLRTLAQSGDVLVIYSDSDHSANIVRAIEAGHNKDLSIIALTGEKSEAIAANLNERDLEIRVASSVGPLVCETHTIITHSLCELIDHQLFDSPL